MFLIRSSAMPLLLCSRRCINIILIFVTALAIPVFAFGADQYNGPVYYTVNNGADSRIDIQKVNDQNYLFLPNEADLSAISFCTDNEQEKVWLGIPESDGMSTILDLSEENLWSNNTCTVRASVTDCNNVPLGDMSTVTIMKGNNIGTLY